MEIPVVAVDEVLSQLQTVIDEAGPLRRQRRTRYDRGWVFQVHLTGVCPAGRARATMTVEKFVGGGFAGQVYRARLNALEPLEGQVAGLTVGRLYAVKLLIPPSGFSRLFRNFVYGLAFQGHFSAQVHPAAARAGVLWQTLIRRAAEVEFERPEVVRNTHATFYDETLGTFGEVSDWVDGRQWLFELDDRLFERRPLDPANPRPDYSRATAPEYLAKKHFMARFVDLLHRVGAPELARQYEWWTCKSQPNVLKRADQGDGPAAGLSAIDFRAGLALLPFLPMSPGDLRLIGRGLRRGALVQFDRGDLGKLAAYVNGHADRFDDLRPALAELQQADPAYRASLIDLTHHGLRPLWNKALRQSIVEGFVSGWQAKHLVDAPHAETLCRRRIPFLVFLLLGFIPLLGRFLRRLWADQNSRRHLASKLSSWSYLKKSIWAHQAEDLIDWRRQERRSAEAISELACNPWFWPQRLFLGWLFPKWHRFLCEPRFAWGILKRYIGGLILFLKDADFRQKWLENLIDEGYREGELTAAEHDELRAQAADPYIRTYLLCLAGHMCGFVVGRSSEMAVAFYCVQHYSDPQEAALRAAAIVLFMNILPINAGSIFRALFTFTVMIVKWNFRDFWIAAALSIWKGIGYLAFPIQMVSKYPTLARFMAGRWAREAVHIVPVFGEHGALLEHAVLDNCFNKPISIRRRIANHQETIVRLVGKIVLAAEWFVFSLLAAWFSYVAAKLHPPTAHDLSNALVFAIAALVALLIWAFLAPPFAWVRRLFWLWLAMAAVPAGLVAIAYRHLIL